MSETINLTGDTSVELKKKGRKPTQLNYFDVREEMAVVRFLETECPHERNKIYNEFLLKPLDKNQSVKDEDIITLLTYHQLVAELKSVK